MNSRILARRACVGIIAFIRIKMAHGQLSVKDVVAKCLMARKREPTEKKRPKTLSLKASSTQSALSIR